MSVSAMAEMRVKKGLEECPDGFVIFKSKTEALKWVEEKSTIINATGGVEIEKIKRAAEGSTFVVTFMEPASVPNHPLSAKNLVAIVNLSVTPPITPTPTGGGSASIAPNAGATLPGFLATLSQYEASEVKKWEALSEERTIEYQKRLLSYIQGFEYVMYDEHLLKMLTPPSVAVQNKLEEDVRYYRHLMWQMSQDLISYQGGGNEFLQGLIDQLIGASALANGNVRDMIALLREQGYLSPGQIMKLAGIAKAEYNIETVEGDVVGGDQYQGDVHINHYHLGGNGNGSSTVHSQECHIESVFP